MRVCRAAAGGGGGRGGGDGGGGAADDDHDDDGRDCGSQKEHGFTAGAPVLALH